ncbi:MAG: HEPN domain-containing protein [Candidatus Thermoplasmatota archaeon]|nr:HEPN domain-containing protein [Euryarchaeota archaeon]MBU4031551.1 HEPN domain-containing protein [Candidatus Thermoplasmatota archaeon]MBU4071525.1 HEPN domain-containing protein [Candidatus Thermoplasmatota archaeon]MBU4144708.1 HEPN domain-containing protein [Candidatus Thermoplasmatota archaeon]MBU4592687.1 HEPN domain-containing protein [Candidatus Thermoplasmatota archaeon]
MVRDIRKLESAKYFSQAEEFMQSANANMDAGRYNAAVFSAVQAMINANDAFTIYYLEKRASTDHRECLKLHADAAGIIQDTSQKDRLKDAINLRSQAGYMGEWMSKTEAEKTLRRATQFLAWVKKKIA